MPHVGVVRGNYPGARQHNNDKYFCKSNGDPIAAENTSINNTNTDTEEYGRYYGLLRRNLTGSAYIYSTTCGKRSGAGIFMTAETGANMSSRGCSQTDIILGRHIKKGHT